MKAFSVSGFLGSINPVVVYRSHWRFGCLLLWCSLFYLFFSVIENFTVLILGVRLWVKRACIIISLIEMVKKKHTWDISRVPHLKDIVSYFLIGGGFISISVKPPEGISKIDASHQYTRLTFRDRKDRFLNYDTKLASLWWVSRSFLWSQHHRDPQCCIKDACVMLPGWQGMQSPWESLSSFLLSWCTLTSRMG